LEIKKYLYDKRGDLKVDGLNSRYFYGGLILKIVLTLFFASPYLTQLFAPFLTRSLHFNDAYTYFHQQSNGVDFPYPSLMLLIFQLPAFIIDLVIPFQEKFTIMHAILFRSVCLFFDFLILIILIRWLKNHSKKVIIYYWCSPILIYITYMHGQLDVVPLALLLVSLYFLFKENGLMCSLFLALAICTKTNIALAIPFIMIYRAHAYKLGFVQAVKEFGLFLVVVLLFNLPFLSEAYLAMVYNNEVQQKTFSAAFSFSEEKLFLLIPAVMLLLLFKMNTYKWVTKDLLLLFLAFAFGTLTLLISPMQGWYYWIIPFFIYFIIKYGGESKRLFFAINICYFFYFLLNINSDFLVLHDWQTPLQHTKTLGQLFSLKQTYLNLSFTALQTTLGLFLFNLYARGIKPHTATKLVSQPFLIGVGGNSGSGKSTLSKVVQDLFGKSNTSIIQGDDMHKWERGHDNWQKITHLNPKANDLNKDFEDIKSLKDGYSILRKKYDHHHGKFTLPFQIKSNRLVVFEGLHSFYLKNQRNLYDLKIYLAPSDEVLLQRKLQRDVKERGKDEATVLKQIEDRKEDSQKFINTQIAEADLIISFYTDKSQLCLKVVLEADIDLDHLLNTLVSGTMLEISHEFLEQNKQMVYFNGTINAEMVELIALDELQMLYEIGINSAWKSDYYGILQLIIGKCIVQQISNNAK